MIFPVIFAVVVWFLTLRWRRRWRGAAVLAAAATLLVGLGVVLKRVEPPIHANGGIAAPSNSGSTAAAGAIGPTSPAAASPAPFRSLLFRLLLWPYTILVGGVGLFIFLLPRGAPTQYHCQRCHYDLAGLRSNQGGVMCPECGTVWVDETAEHADDARPASDAAHAGRVGQGAASPSAAT